MKQGDGSPASLLIKQETVPILMIVGSLLHRINQRIEVLYSRDHMIGHAYFNECEYGRGRNRHNAK